MSKLSLSIPGYNNIQPPTGVPTGGLGSGGTLEKIIQIGIQILIILGVVLALFFIIFSAIQWVTSEGDKQKLQAARNRLTYTIIGLLVILLAIFLVNFVGGAFGINLFRIL